DANLMDELVTLLLDKEPYARIGAVRALAASGRPEAVPLLLYKTRLGDQEADVMGECFNGMLAFRREEAIPLVAEFLKGGDEVGERAALALAGVRNEAAFAALRQAWEAAATAPFRRALLTAIATMRIDAAFAFLAGLIASGTERQAADAQAAFEI